MAEKRKFADMVKDIVGDLQRNPMKNRAARARCNNQRTFEEMISFIVDLKDSKQICTTELISSAKSEKEADTLRKSGNQYFQKKNYDFALKDYNLSIMHADHPILRRSRDETDTESPDFPYIDPAKYGGTEKECKMLYVGFANRSAVLFEMGLYKECVSDIELAFEYGYPEKYRATLNERKENSLHFINFMNLSQMESDKSEELHIDSSDKSNTVKSPIEAIAKGNYSESSRDADTTDKSGESRIELSETSSNHRESHLDRSATRDASELPVDKGDAGNSGKSLRDASATANSGESHSDGNSTDYFGKAPLDAGNSGKSHPDVGATNISGGTSLEASDIDKSGEKPLNAGPTDNSGELPLCAISMNSSRELHFHPGAKAAKEQSNQDKETTLNYLLSSLKISETPLSPLASNKTKAASNKTKATTKTRTALAMPPFGHSIKLGFLPSKGRCLIAARDLRPGEILGAEEAHSLNIQIHRLLLYCSTCVTKCLNPLPCPSCTKVIFCSEKCRTKGLSKYHWLECQILPTIESLDVTPRNLSIKMLRTLSYPKLCDLLNKLEKDQTNPAEFDCCSEGVYVADSYRPIYHLCTHKNRYGFEFLFMQCIISYVFTLLLQQSGRFFVDENGNPVSPTREAIIRTGATLLSHTLKLHCNPFQIWDRDTKCTIGNGLFPLLGLLNHSCYPNVRHYSSCNAIIVRAVRPIAAGEELSISYTYEFHKASIEERISALDKYYFNCSCEACQNDWPTFDDLPTLTFKCLECKKPLTGHLKICSDCLAKYSKPIAKKKKQQGKDEIENVWDCVLNSCALDSKLSKGASWEDYLLVCESIELMYKHLQMPCQHIIVLQNLLTKCIEHRL